VVTLSVNDKNLSPMNMISQQNTENVFNIHGSTAEQLSANQIVLDMGGRSGMREKHQLLPPISQQAN